MYRTIYKVRFKDGHEAYFGCLSAIYVLYTPEQIGCKVTNLWNRRIRYGKPYVGRLCTISREMLVCKSRNKEK